MNDVNRRILEMLKAFKQKGKPPGGVDALVQMLERMDRRSEQQILQAIRTQNPELWEELKEKYFTFEDLLMMKDAVLRKALEEIHRTTLTVSLIGVPENIREKIFHNLSQRAAMRVKEDIELLGAKPRTLVEEAQREVTRVLRRWRKVIL